VYAKFRCAALRIKKALTIFRELITTKRRTTTTRVAFWDPPSGQRWKRSPGHGSPGHRVSDFGRVGSGHASMCQTLCLSRF